MSDKNRPSRLAARMVNVTYPSIRKGAPHWRTRDKQRTAWQLGYLKGYEDAMRSVIKDWGNDNERFAETSED